MRMEILAVIPARGGSKGVPRKNIAPLAGRPMLAYTADAALGARRLCGAVLSTDSEEIAAVGRELGLDVPFLRPEELARDDTPTVPVIQHAVRFMQQQGRTVDAVCLLQPTCPFRTAEMVDLACERFESLHADTLLSVLPIPHQHNPFWALIPGAEPGLLRWAADQDQPPPRRQVLPSAWHREGSIYIVRTEILLQRGSLYGPRIVAFEVDPARSVNIDTPEDLRRAEQLMAPPGGPATEAPSP
jgi:CMP-N,N'-diacetyllegionaminic acid synthase